MKIEMLKVIVRHDQTPHVGKDSMKKCREAEPKKGATKREIRRRSVETRSRFGYFAEIDDIRNWWQCMNANGHSRLVFQKNRSVSTTTARLLTILIRPGREIL